jgi:hypothetical protein
MGCSSQFEAIAELVFKDEHLFNGLGAKVKARYQVAALTSIKYHCYV